MKKFTEIDYHYVYTIDFDTKTIKEYQVKDYDINPKGCYTCFPYKECGFEDPLSLINDLQWTCIAFDGGVVKE